MTMTCERCQLPTMPEEMSKDNYHCKSCYETIKALADTADFDTVCQPQPQVKLSCEGQHSFTRSEHLCDQVMVRPRDERSESRRFVESREEMTRAIVICAIRGNRVLHLETGDEYMILAGNEKEIICIKPDLRFDGDHRRLEVDLRAALKWSFKPDELVLI